MFNPLLMFRCRMTLRGTELGCGARVGEACREIVNYQPLPVSPHITRRAIAARADRALYNLGCNLAVAGALTHSYLVGFARGFYYDCDDGETWRPNISGKAAPRLPPGTDDTGRGT